MQRFVYNTFSHDGPWTLGVDFAMRKVYIDGEVIKVQIWDIGTYLHNMKPCTHWSDHVHVCMHSCFNVVIFLL